MRNERGRDHLVEACAEDHLTQHPLAVLGRRDVPARVPRARQRGGDAADAVDPTNLFDNVLRQFDVEAENRRQHIPRALV